jgi:hypothetical protein
MTAFEPELGQIVFGQPTKQYATSELVHAALSHLRDEMDRVMWNHHQREYSSPFGNTGSSFKCDSFEVHAYSWSDDEQPFNFKWGDLEISWYKYLGRGMSANKDITPDTLSSMLDDCIAAMRRYEIEHHPRKHDDD